MTTLETKIINLKSEIRDWRLALKPSLLCDKHIQKLEAELDKLLEENRAEEEIEGWG